MASSQIDSLGMASGYGGDLDTQAGMLERAHSSVPRPESAIQIIRYPDDATEEKRNPQPKLSEEKIFGEFISPQKLKELSGTDHLNELTTLELKVDTTETSIGNMGTMAPNLKTLKLNNSYLTSVRDLGTNLNNLQALWLSRCCLAELDGIGCIAALKELYLAFNEVFDLSPLSMLENLEVLDLEGNEVDDISQVEFLSLCSKLRCLTLEGNPVCKAPNPQCNEADLNYYSYRDAVLSHTPQLSMLDGEEFLTELVNGQTVKRSRPPSMPVEQPKNFEDDLLFIQDNLKSIDESALEEEDDDEILKATTDDVQRRPSSSYSRPKTASMHGRSSARPGSSAASRPGTASGSRPSSSGSRSASGSNSREALPIISDLDECSELTHGGVICGNPVRELQRRRRAEHTNKQQLPDAATVVAPTANRMFVPERSYYDDDDSQDQADILEELMTWRANNKSIFDDVIAAGSSLVSDVTSSSDVTSASTSSVRAKQVAPSEDRTDALELSTSPGFSPTPPPKPRQQRGRVVSPRTNSIRRSLQAAGISAPPPEASRPHTAADFRTSGHLSSSNFVSNTDANNNAACSTGRSGSPGKRLDKIQESSVPEHSVSSSSGVAMGSTDRTHPRVANSNRAHRPGTARAAVHVPKTNKHS